MLYLKSRMHEMQIGGKLPWNIISRAHAAAAACGLLARVRILVAAAAACGLLAKFRILGRPHLTQLP